MTVLIFGMLIFYGVHLLPHFRSIKALLMHRLGDRGYLGGFAVVSFLGMGLMVYGKITADYVQLWDGLMSLRHLTYLMVLMSFILLMAMCIPCNIRRSIHHPMLLGLLMWSLGHLLVNGDLASSLFFGGFAVYSLFALVSVFIQGKRCNLPKQAVWKDGMVIAFGVLIYAVVAKFHGVLFSVPLMPS